MRWVLTATSLVLALTLQVAPARAEESDAEAAIGLPGTLGLSGMQDLVDARSLELSIRAGTRYQLLVEGQDFDGAVRLERDRTRHEFVAYAGGSVLELVDASIRYPWVYDSEDQDFRGARDIDDSDTGWGDVDLAAKVSLELGPVDVAPYVHGRFPTGEPATRDLIEFTYGVAATFSLLNEYLGFHANLAGFQREEGLSAIRYRLGASFVVWTEPVALVRLYAYADGIEWEGSADSDLDLELGAQAILFDLLTLELGGSVRLIEAGFLDESVKRELRGERGVLDRHFSADRTWTLQVGVGVIF